MLMNDTRCTGSQIIALSFFNTVFQNRNDIVQYYVNVVGCLVKGRAGNSHYFKNCIVCWMCGFNRLEPAML